MQAETHIICNEVSVGDKFGDFNPMLLQDVIEKIFAFSSFQDLKRFRLVCQLWKPVCTKLLAESCRTIRIKGSKPWVDKEENCYKICLWENLLPLIDVISNNDKTGFPCTKFSIQSEQNASSVELANIKTCIEAVRAWVTHLEIEDNADNPIVPVCYSSNVTCEKLKQLSVYFWENKKHQRKHTQGNIDFVTGILASAPNLEELAFLTTQGVETAARFFDAFSHIRFRKLTCLELTGDISGKELLKIKSMKLNLQTLSLRITSASQVTDNEMTEFLNCQKRFLQKLTIGVNLVMVLHLPILPCLRSFKVCRVYQHGQSLAQFPLIEYHTQLPVLENLMISSIDGFDMRRFCNSYIPAATSVTQLELPGDVKTVAVVEKLVQVFPNLKKLKIVKAQPPILLACKETMSQLEELTITVGDYKSTLELLLMSLTDETGFHPCFTELKILKIQSHRALTSNLTDICCQRILDNFRSLERLYLNDVSVGKISKDVLDAMKSRFIVSLAERGSAKSAQETVLKSYIAEPKPLYGITLAYNDETSDTLDIIELVLD